MEKRNAKEDFDEEQFNIKMLDLANHGLPQAMYTYGKNLLIMVQTSRFEKQSE